jgi:GNAT superfamily N-acetyltransferase
MTAEASREDGLPQPALDVELVRAHGFGAHPLFEAWLAEDGRGTALGCVLASKGYDVQRACATLVVMVLYVAPEARRSGLARIMIGAMARRAMEMGALELIITTGIENAAARAFFASIAAGESVQTRFMLGRDQIEWLAQETA